MDLRTKIVESVRKGISKSETACRFGVSRSTVKRYLKRLDGVSPPVVSDIEVSPPSSYVDLKLRAGKRLDAVRSTPPFSRASSAA